MWSFVGSLQGVLTMWLHCGFSEDQSMQSLQAAYELQHIVDVTNAKCPLAQSR